MLENLREGVPAGKFRVIRIDQLSDKEFLIKDCDRNEAFEIADEYNKTRICVSQDVYYVYDDEGELLRSWKDVKNSEGETVGVLP